MKTKNQKKIKEIKEISQTTHNQIKIPHPKQLQNELQITKQNLQQKIMTLNQQQDETTDIETKLKIRDEYINTREYLKDITMAYNEIQSINKKLDEITTEITTNCIFKVDSCNCLYVQFLLFQKLCSFLVNI